MSETALQVGCKVASNAGFFNTRTGACLGNLISDGVVIQNTGRHNGTYRRLGPPNGLALPVGNPTTLGVENLLTRLVARQRTQPTLG